MASQYELWTRKIEDLLPQQAFVKYTRHVPKLFRLFMHHIRTIKVKTVTVPKSKTTEEQLQKLKNYYAEKLMKPLNQVQQVKVPVVATPVRPRWLKVD